MTARVAIAFAFLLVAALPGAAATPAAEAGTTYGPGVRSAIASEGPEILSNATVQDALGAGAFAGAMEEAAEASSWSEQARQWESAQSAASPAYAYLVALANEANANAQSLLANFSALGAATVPGIGGFEAERLLAAANLLVDAESANQLGMAYIQGQNTGHVTVSNPTQRYTMQRPITLARIETAAAHSILQLPARGGPAFDLAAVDRKVTSQGGDPGKWVLPESGTIHRLARHLHTFWGQQGNATAAQVRGDVAQGGPALALATGAGLSGITVVARQQDAGWWLQHAGPLTGSAADRFLLAQVHGSLETAAYEATLLAAGASGGASFWLWAAACVGILAGGIAMAFALLRRRSRRRPAQGLLVSLLVAGMLVALLPAAHGEPFPNDPRKVAVSLDNSSSASGFGNLAVTADGVAHVVWDECVGTQRVGCWQILERTFDPSSGAWGDQHVLMQVAGRNLYSPRVYSNGGTLALLYVQTDTDQDIHSGRPFVLYACILKGDACSSPALVSPATAQVLAPSGAFGPDGRLRVVWQEEDAASNTAILAFRQQTASGWGPRVTFPGSGTQRNGAVAVDGSGTAHVVWSERWPSEDPRGTQVRREVAYASVADGAASASNTKLVSHRSVYEYHGSSVAVEANGTVAVLYGTQAEAWLRELPTGGNWTAPQNVSRMGNVQAITPFLQVLADGTLLASWQTGGQGTYDLWTARREGGSWLSPRSILDDADRQSFYLPSVLQGPDGSIHSTWLGTSPQVSTMHQHYRLWTPQALAGNGVPSIAGTSPGGPGRTGWVNTTEVALQAWVKAGDAQLDATQTAFTVDGDSVATSLTSDGLAAATAHGLAEGAHTVAFQVTDANGKTATSSWTVTVDRSPPSLTESLRDQAGKDAQGWGTSPLTLQANAAPGAGGAPSHLQISFNDDGQWKEVNASLLAHHAISWSGSSGTLPEGILFTVRLRALDAAGNVALGKAHAAGWDITAPNAILAVPAWSGPTLTARATDHARGSSDPMGSPLVVRLRVMDASGRQVASGQGDDVVTVTGLAAGVYQVAATIRDEAGNAQAVDPPAVTVSVDASPPAVSVAKSPDGRIVATASDVDSGVVALTAMEGDLVMEDFGANPGNASKTASVAFLWPSQTADVTLQAKDAVGNAVTYTLAPDLTLHEQSDGVQPIGQGSEGHHGTPGASLAALVLVLALVSCAIRRRSGGSRPLAEPGTTCDLP